MIARSAGGSPGAGCLDVKDSLRPLPTGAWDNLRDVIAERDSRDEHATRLEIGQSTDQRIGAGVPIDCRHARASADVWAFMTCVTPNSCTAFATRSTRRPARIVPESSTPRPEGARRHENHVGFVAAPKVEQWERRDNTRRPLVRNAAPP